MTCTRFLLALASLAVVSNTVTAAAPIGHQETASVAPMMQPGEARSSDVAAVTARWQSTGVLVEAGDSYLVTASGQWKVAPVCPPTGPDGHGLYTLVCWDIGGQTLPGASHALLIGKIGHHGLPFAVGSNLDLLANATGVLYLMTNDAADWFSDNTGRMRVTVRLLGKASPPATQAAPAPEVKRGGGGGGRTPQQ